MFYEPKSCLFAIFLHFCVISCKKKIGPPPAAKGGGYKNRSPGGVCFWALGGGVPQEVPIRAPIYGRNVLMQLGVSVLSFLIKFPARVFKQDVKTFEKRSMEILKFCL